MNASSAAVVPEEGWPETAEDDAEITTAVTTPLPDTSPQAGVIAGQGVSRKQKTIDGTGGPSVDKTEDGPSTKDKKPPQRQVSISQLLSYADGTDKLYMAVGTIAALASACSMPLFIIAFGDTLDGLGEPPPTGEEPSVLESVKGFVVMFVIIGVVSGVSGFAMVSLWTIAGERQALRIRRQYVKCILKQDIAWFDENPAGQLPTAITSNMAKIQDGLGRKVGDIVLNGVSGVALLATGMWINWQLGLVMLSCIPFIGATVAAMTVIMSGSSQEGTDYYAKAGGVANEVLSGIRTVASLNSEELELERYSRHLDGAYKAGIREGISKGLGNGVMYSSFYMSYGLAFWYGTKQVADGGGRSGGDVIASIFAVLMGAVMFGQTAPGVMALSLARGAAAEVFETLDRVPPIDSSSKEGLKPNNVDGLVTFHHISFRYPARPQDTVYESMSLEVQVGKTLALVGPSGGGKSTITKLLLRFYDPNSGTITLDGHDIKSLNVNWYRRQIGYVGQEPVLFAGTIGVNIANGREGSVSGEKITEAAKAANAHEFIQGFPDGYDTTVGEGGFQLSGGQKQRIAIARAIIKDPAILLLDEATSALDSESEKVVQHALDKLHKDKPRTTVIIAHRLSTIQDAARIAVIDKDVVELGTHSELLALNGVYATLCSGQGGGPNTLFAKNSRDESVAGPVDITETSIDGPSRIQAPEVEHVGGAMVIPASMDNTPASSKQDKKDLDKLPAPSGKRLWALNKDDWPWILMGFVGAIIVGGCYPSEGVFLAQVQSNMYHPDTDKMRRVGNLWALGFVGLGMCSLAGNIALAAGFAVSGERLTRTLRNMAFKAMVRRDIAWFDRDEATVGILTTRLEAEASAVRKATGTNMAHTTQLIMTLLVGNAIGLGFSWQIGLLAMAMVPMIAAAGVVQMAMLTGGYGDNDGLDGGNKAAGLLSSSLQGMTTVTAFNMQETLTEEYKEASEASFDARRKRGLIAGASFGYAQAVTFWVFATLFYVGAILVDDHQVEYESFFTAMFAVLLGAMGVGQIGADSKEVSEGKQAAAKVFLLTDEPLKIDPLSDGGAKPDRTDGALEFKNVFFAYPTRPKMQIYGSGKYPGGFCLNVSAGETIALVGPSGCGKSTCMGLLLRFYEPTRGSVLIDGRDIREVNVKWLRGQIGYVGQEPVLFQGTIRENIAKGDPTASQERIVEAARAANAHDFIMAFKEGFDADVGEKSALLSGGQKQRIAIARAILKDPRVLLLDEATSALDNESEKMVQQALDHLQAQQKRTTLTVTHRLTSVRNSDKIAVLNGGGVQELGTHDELLTRSGMYSMLWHQQTDKMAKNREATNA